MSRVAPAKFPPHCTSPARVRRIHFASHRFKSKVPHGTSNREPPPRTRTLLVCRLAPARKFGALGGGTGAAGIRSRGDGGDGEAPLARLWTITRRKARDVQEQRLGYWKFRVGGRGERHRSFPVSARRTVIESPHEL